MTALCFTFIRLADALSKVTYGEFRKQKSDISLVQ